MLWVLRRVAKSFCEQISNSVLNANDWRGPYASAFISSVETVGSPDIKSTDVEEAIVHTLTDPYLTSSFTLYVLKWQNVWENGNAILSLSLLSTTEESTHHPKMLNIYRSSSKANLLSWYPNVVWALPEDSCKLYVPWDYNNTITLFISHNWCRVDESSSSFFPLVTNHGKLAPSEEKDKTSARIFSWATVLSDEAVKEYWLIDAFPSIHSPSSKV